MSKYGMLIRAYRMCVTRADALAQLCGAEATAYGLGISMCALLGQREMHGVCRLLSGAHQIVEAHHSISVLASRYHR